ncbi:MAG: ATP-binding protein [Sulfitobacter sp.]
MSETLSRTNHPQTRPAECVAGGSKDFEDFVYLISHDVRSSVRALIELPQWIAEDLEESGVKLDGAVAENIKMMNRHTGRLDRMLVDLLAFSRIGRMQQAQIVDLNAALTDVLDEITVPSGFQIIRALDAADAFIGERDILTLLSALISNAIKHHDRETGKIIVSSLRKNNQTLISVCDNGPGIPEGYHARVFEAMTTLKPRDEVEGSGMGLAMIQKIARHYHGTASIRTNARTRGTCIEVYLPSQLRA